MLTPAQEKKAKTVPPKYRNMYREAASGRSREAACRVFCAECVSYVYAEVVACTSPGCPLYPYRLSAEARRDPGTPETEPLTQEEARQDGQEATITPSEAPQPYHGDEPGESDPEGPVA